MLGQGWRMAGGVVAFLLGTGLSGCGDVTEDQGNQGDRGYPAMTTEAEFLLAMEELSNWGRWGADDELGAANLITPAKRRSAAALVIEGLSVSLAHDVVQSSAGLRRRNTAVNAVGWRWTPRLLDDSE